MLQNPKSYQIEKKWYTPQYETPENIVKEWIAQSPETHNLEPIAFDSRVSLPFVTVMEGRKVVFFGTEENKQEAIETANRIKSNASTYANNQLFAVNYPSCYGSRRAGITIGDVSAYVIFEKREVTKEWYYFFRPNGALNLIRIKEQELKKHEFRIIE